MNRVTPTAQHGWRLRAAAAAFALLALPTAAHARLHLVRIGRFASPVYVAAPPADRARVFVVERAGRIVVVRRGHKLRRPFLDIRGRVSVGGERGLLSMAFAPDYARGGRFYVYYSDRSGDIRVVEFRRAAGGDRALRGSGRNVLKIEHNPFPHHYGGQLQFGPDGLLYVGVGDGASRDDKLNRGQRLDTPLAKLLRIDPRPAGGQPFGIPLDNPFVGRSDARHDIYAYGLRNPWRFSFDRRDGAIVIGDVGEERFEEIDYEPRGAAAGRNFGWNRFEGRARFQPGDAPNYAPPVLVHSHRAGFCAIVGGYVVRDRSLRGLYGRYVYGDDCNPRLYSVRLGPERASGDRPLGLRARHVVSFGEDSRARMYVVSLAGPVYRLAD
ncbi:MAG TPA: PQQ-dependent sugar dehydrogenase [Solirubrobacterales bacterium]|nr:PQQ-dependent sugar dehydrogenase [Solirubrobacterales bacterium]